ncbi:MAG: helicase [Rhodospirillaceae bacterium TMED8]|nr:helicase [Magnetovibrio sp.]OUT48548.1 MAG: helicase [Rhodospirillaceae bacterium TMED8]
MTGRSKIKLPIRPSVVVGSRQSTWLTLDGEIETLNAGETARRLAAGVCPIICHSRAAERRLSTPPFIAADILELFAFVHPARFTIPTSLGLAEYLGLPLPNTTEDEAESLLAAAYMLHSQLAELASVDPEAAQISGSQAEFMTLKGWAWGSSVLSALGHPRNLDPRNKSDALRVWQSLPEWEDEVLETSSEHHSVSSAAARKRLIKLLGPNAEDRKEQLSYVDTCTHAFSPRNQSEAPNLVLAEAGTGIGKTLGYVAPASLWAEQNDGAVWISTYTRNLQRQLNTELDRLYLTSEEKEAKVVIRKGRENYLCLLNLAEAIERISSSSLPVDNNNNAIVLSLVARWAAASRDGDMLGGDFPAWLTDIFGHQLTTSLTDTRGECIFSACDHYRRCFIEHTQRRTNRADLVIANHALVLVQAAMGGAGSTHDQFNPNNIPTRYIFDEGHQLFDASDNAFAANLSGREAADIRGWLIGAEGSSKRGARGLRARVIDLIANDTKARELLDDALKHARLFPRQGWEIRISTGNPAGPIEAFLSLVRQQVYARDPNVDSYYDLETGVHPHVPGLISAAEKLRIALQGLEKPLEKLIACLNERLDSDADTLDSLTRGRIVNIMQSIRWRCLIPIRVWKSMLYGLNGETPTEFVDWFAVQRIDGQDFDIGYRRHWLDPTQPLSEFVFAPAHGVLITSATLRDRTADNDEIAWSGAETRTGARHLPVALLQSAHPSPFNYAAQTQVLVVNDVGRNDTSQTAAAYRELFIAAGGGGLGLFTAIHRLQAVYHRIAVQMEEANIKLLAQHIEAMDAGTLIDIFRAEENTCLLGTDAVRDGVDIPGQSLRLIVFDRVPWPRPSLIHKARKREFGGRAYDELLARLKLKQAYGRLIRRATDKGIFVLLDRAMPTRMGDAFPEGVELHRMGLAEAVTKVRSFLTIDTE